VRAFLTLAASILTPALLAQTGVTVEGTVLNNVTGSGVAGVTVRLWTQQGAHYETTTDESGVYRVTGMPPGDYDSRFERTGFGEVETDFAAPLVAQRLHVAPAKDAVRWNHQLAPLATVRGRVTGVDGKPAADVEVTIAPGPEGFTRTNEDGWFVFDKLRPGSYAIRANPPAGSQAVVREGVRIETVTTFYPAATDRTAAQMLAVRGGSDQSGFEIRLQEAPVYGVRGVVVDDAGQPVSGAYVRLASFAAGSYLTGQMLLGSPQGARYLLVGRLPATEEASFTTKGDGRFEFPSVRSGDWHILAESERGEAAGATRRAILWTGQAPALVARHDLDDLEIRLAPPVTREGIVDWGDLPVAPPDRRSYVRLIDADSGRVTLGFGRPDGTVHFENLAAGRYRIIPTAGLTAGYYPSAVFLGDHEVTGQEVALHATSPPIRMVMRAHPGTIRGTVENGAGATVLLAPQTSTEPDALLAIQCGADGAFQIPGLPPGDYSIVAFDRVGTEPGSNVRMPAVLAAAVRVRVDEGAGATVQLTVNRWPE
jgi:protocatechuate 3,4-dioxygenase beta subunit